MLVLALAGAALAATPAAAGARAGHVTTHAAARVAAHGATVQGTAVRRQARRHAWIVAGRNGTLRLVRTTASLRPGTKVSVRGAALRDQTIRAHSLQRLGTRRLVRVSGVVVARTARTLTIAENGAVLTIRRHSHLRRGARRLASDTGTAPPALGTAISVTVKVDDQGDVEQDDNVQEENDNQNGHDHNAELSGLVVSVTPATGGTSHVLINLGDSNTQVVLIAPAGLDLTGLAAGTEAEFKVNIAADPATGENTITIVRFQQDESNGDNNDQGDNDQGDGSGHGDGSGGGGGSD
jgi:hypothetical protein